jgi:transcriptional regulator with XRE-family HTH domain
MMAMMHPIKAYRRKHGLSLQVLAERVRTTRSTLSRVEAGLIKPSFDLLDRLTGATGGEISADAIIEASRRQARAACRLVNGGARP